MSINIGYFLKEAGQSFKRNWVMSLGAIITIFLSLLLIGTSLMVTGIASSLIDHVESKVSIQVFIRDDAAPQDITALQTQLTADPMVKTVNFTNKEQALEEFRKRMANSPEIIANLEDTNPLPASLDVELKNAQDVEKVAATIQGSEAFTKVADRPEQPERSIKYSQQIVKKLFAFTNVARVVGSVFVIMLGIVSLIFISNTIRLAIYARRQEIAIMRLVGASNWFIRGPFLLEGVYQALIGAILAIGALMTIQYAGIPKLQESLTFLPFTLSNADMVTISFSLVIAGVFIGALGSWIAMRKYLKV